MPLVDTDYKKLLLRNTGNAKQLTDNNLEGLNLVWVRHDNESNLELQYCRALIDAFQLIMGFTWQDYNMRTAAGEQINGSEPFQHLVTMCQQAQSYIDLQGTAAMGEGGGEPLSQTMAGTAPLETPVGFYPDPNDTYYQGDPLALWRKQWSTHP